MERPAVRLATVSGAVPYAPGRSHRADGGSRAAPSVRLPVPMVAAVDADFRRCFKCRRSGDRPKRHETMRKPMERRQGRWNDRRPDAGHSFFRNAARAKPPPLRPREVSLPRRPRRPLLSQDLCSRGGSSRLPRPRPHRAAARPRPCRRANTQRSSRRVLAARRPPSCGSTRRRASTTIREPAITGTPSRAHICARLTRARAAIVRRGTANVRRRLIRG